MPRANIGDAEIYYEVHGDGAPVFLVTGLGGNMSFWEQQTSMFAERYKVILHDHRGAGRSTMSRIDYSVEGLAGDVIALMDFLGIAQVHFVGHSLGGAIGQVLGIERPERLRSLVISSSWTTADPYYRRLFEVRKGILAASGIPAYFRSGTLFLYPPRYIASNIEAIERTEEAMIADAPPNEIVESKIAAVLKFDRTHELSRIATSTLVNCAVDDIITPLYFSESLATMIPGATLRVLDGGAHFTPITAARAYFEQVAAFISAHC